ncbi:hypothetical protein Rm378p036 [Rhodothermus phage RM378]|uniref:hypothetical protein n=1 Tax=Rhodothermus phage RM378 TaxID=148943 RepID=UPI000018F62E|nr:hypothetical protein Rm378p036 [Rhodothermus phage RM378]
MQFDINFARKLAQKINEDPTLNIEIDPETATEQELKSMFFSFVKDKVKKELVDRIMQSAKTTYNTPLPEQAQVFILQGIVAMYTNRSDESHIPVENRFYYHNMLSNVDKLAALFVINKKLSQEGRKDELHSMKFKFIKSFIDLEQIIDTYLPSYTVRYLDRWNNTMEAVRKYIKNGDIELVYHNKPEMEDSDAVLVRLLPEISYQGIKEMLTETNTNKSTTVCIAQNDSYWDNYKHDYVFILFIHPRNDFYHKIKVSTFTGTIETSGVIAHVITYKSTDIREYKNQFNQNLETLSLPLPIIKEINFKIAEIIGLSDKAKKELEELYSTLDKFMKNVSPEALLLLQNLVSNIYILQPSQSLDEKVIEGIVKTIAQNVINKVIGLSVNSKEIKEGIESVGKVLNIWLNTDFQEYVPGYDLWNQLKDKIKDFISFFIRESQLEVISDIISSETFRIAEANYEEDSPLVKNVKLQFIPPESSSAIDLVGDFHLQNEVVYKTLRDKFININRKKIENNLKFFIDYKYQDLVRPNNEKTKKTVFDLFSTFLASLVIENKVKQYESKREEILNEIIPKLKDEIIKTLFGTPTRDFNDATRENILKYKDIIMDVDKISIIIDTYKSLLGLKDNGLKDNVSNTYRLFIPSVVLHLSDPRNFFSSNNSNMITNLWKTVITILNDDELLKAITDQAIKTIPQNKSILDEIKDVLVKNVMNTDDRYYKMMLDILINAFFSSKKYVERFVNAILVQIYDTSYFVVHIDYVDYVLRKRKTEDDTDLDIDIDIFEF